MTTNRSDIWMLALPAGHEIDWEALRAAVEEMPDGVAQGMVGEVGNNGDVIHHVDDARRHYLAGLDEVRIGWDENVDKRTLGPVTIHALVQADDESDWQVAFDDLDSVHLFDHVEGAYALEA